MESDLKFGDKPECLRSKCPWLRSKGRQPGFKRPSRLRGDHVICILLLSIRSRTNLRYTDFIQGDRVERQQGAHQSQNRSA